MPEELLELLELFWDDITTAPELVRGLLIGTVSEVGKDSDRDTETKKNNQWIENKS